jgi:imidazolonepropionase-like amidohydrolase
VDLGGPLSLLALRDAIGRGDALGPRIHAAGPFLTAVGSHPCETFPDPTLCTFVDATDAGAVATARVDAGADVLKVALADASFTPWGETPRLDVAVLDAVVAAGRPVWAHVDEDEDVVDAVEHGVAVLAHPVFAAPMGAAALAAASRAEGVTSTVSAFANVGRREALVAADPAIQADWDSADPDAIAPGFAEESAAWAANARANLAALRAAGARVLPGSDAGYYFVPHGTGLLDELDALVALGWTPVEAIGAATVEARGVLGVEGGRVEAGAPADLVLVEGDPSADLAALRSVRRVWVGGVAWDAEADLLPAPTEGVCLEDADCAPTEACDGLQHACGGACAPAYASANDCGAESWCMPADGVATTTSGVCHGETPCDLYGQDCSPAYYGQACVPYDLDTAACWYGGPRGPGDRCSWDEPDAACEPGLFCSHIDARCYVLCDPDAPDTCAVGSCQRQRAEGGEAWFGLCL